MVFERRLVLVERCISKCKSAMFAFLHQEMECKSRHIRLHRKFEQAIDSSQDGHTRMAALLAIIRTTNAAVTAQQCYEVQGVLRRMQGLLPIVHLFPAVSP